MVDYLLSFYSYTLFNHVYSTLGHTNVKGILATMRKETFENEIEINGRLLPINTYNGKKSCYVEMLKAIDDQMTAMLSHYSRVLMVRVDVRVHGRDPNNEVISDYIRRMRRWVMDKYKTPRMGYVWCRELSTDKQLHYHVILLIHGQNVSNGHAITEKSQQIAMHHAHRGYRSVPFLPKPKPKPENGNHDDKQSRMIKQGDDAAYAKAFYHASYLAKSRTKDKKNRSPKAKNFSTSRIAHKAAAPINSNHLTDDERQYDLFAS